MYCISCGKLIDDDSIFCEFCREKQIKPDIPADKLPAVPLPEEKEKTNVIPVIPETPEIPEIPDSTEDTEELDAEVAGIGELLGDDMLRKSAKKDKKLPDETFDDEEAADDSFAPADYNARFGGEPDPAPFYERPEYAAAEEEYAETTGTSAKTAVRVGAGRRIGAVLVSVFAIAVLIVLSLAFSIRLGASGELIRKRTESMSIDNVLDADFDGESFSDNMYDGLDFAEAVGGKTDKYSFRDFMGRTEFLHFAGEKLAGYADCIVGGGETDPSVTDSDIISFMKDSDEAAQSVYGSRFSSEALDIMRNGLEKNGFTDAVSLDSLSRSVGISLQNLSYIFSYITIGIFLALELVLLIWIAIILDRQMKFLAGRYGAVFIISGAAVLLVAAAVSLGAAAAYVQTGWFEFYVCSSLTVPFALFAGCTGIFEIIIGIIFHKISRLLRNREKRNKAVEKALSEYTL